MMAAKTMTTLTPQPSKFRLKGWHVLAIILGFFAVVFAVNFVMAYLAIETFSGIQTEKPYESGLAFNSEIANANAQNARHWTVTEQISRHDDGLVTLKTTFKDDEDRGLIGLEITATLKAPVDAKRDQMIVLSDRGNGLYDGQTAASAGQWDLETIAKQNNVVMYRSINRVILK